MEEIAVIGAGAWGTTLATLLFQKGKRVLLYEKFPDYGKILADKRENPKFLPGFYIPEGLKITSSLEETKSADAFILVTPSFAFRETVVSLKEAGIRGPFLIATKGLEEGTGCRMSEILLSEAGEEVPFAVLSGPTIAREIASGLPASAVCAGSDMNLTQSFQALVNSEKFRIYTGSDPLGVELGGALKNPLAIAAGIAEGLGFGENTRAALLCRGLAEMARLAKALGAQERTIFGLSGLGDLITTANSPFSRNHRFGLAVGQGEVPTVLIARSESVVEGYYTVRPALMLAEKNSIEMPIMAEVSEILFNGKNPQVAVQDLMARPLKTE